MEKQDLYFFFNPYTGLIKIGVANDPDYRRRTLEFACGVRLEALAVFPNQAHYEALLHEAFAESRQVGEWFVPTRDLMGVIERAETVVSLLARYADRIAEYRRVAAAREQQEKDRNREEREREKERLAAVRAEERRVKREEAARRAASKRRREEREAARLAGERERIEQEQAAWAVGAPSIRLGVYRPLIVERTAVVRRRDAQ